VNTQNFTRANKIFTKALTALGVVMLVASTASAEWTVDFSRRARAVRETDLSDAGEDFPARGPASVTPTENIGKKEDAPKGVFDTVFDSGEPVQEIVIMNTEKGFVPATVRVRSGGRYKISVVNVNEKEKNVSFILDGFSEHHSTYYGKVKTFMLEPKKDGVFSYVSPETAFEGRLVVFNPQITLRAPATASASVETKAP
jgi:Cupredoxin-like domain